MTDSEEPFALASDPRLFDPDVEAPISRVADFEVVRKLASHDGVSSYLATRKGAFGFTKRVMLKVAESSFQDGLDVALRLTDEARLGMRLSHPNLVQTLDLGRDDDRFFLVREWVDGVGLRAMMLAVWRAGGSLPLPAVLRTGICVCRVLSYLHGLRVAPWAPNGLVHRGVTPSNIIVSNAGELRLANLFMARASGRIEGKTDLRSTTRLIPAYMAPELTAGRAAVPQSDIFSLGAVLFEAVVGEHAFEGDPSSDWNRYRDDDRLNPLLAEAPISDDLREVIGRATAPSPDHRYASAAAFKDDLRRILRDEHRADGDEELRQLVGRYSTS